jgi:hypothetical protein
MTVSDRIRIKSIRPLSNGHFKFNAVTFEWRRDDGHWQTLNREILDRGDAATLLPYNLAQRSVVLVKQFRYPAYANGHDDLLIEAAAGLLDEAPRRNASASKPRKRPAIDCRPSRRYSKPS